MKCRICQSEATKFLDLGSTPLADKFPTSPDEEEIYYPLEVYVCETCWLVQLKDSVEDNELYGSDYAFFTGTSPSAVKHFEQYATAINDRFRSEGERLVLEIASNDGTLLQMFKDRGWKVLGVDPAEPPVIKARQQGIDTVLSHFTGELASTLGVKADLVLANNVIAHVKDPVDALRGIKTVLNEYGTAVVEFQHFQSLMEHCEFDHFYHEHRSYFSLQSFQKAATEAGLRVWDVEKVDTQGGSLRVFLCHPEHVHETTEAVTKILEEEQKAGLYEFENYWLLNERVCSIVVNLRTMLIDLKAEGKRVAVYGASAKSCTLLNQILDSFKVVCSEDVKHFKIDYIEDTTPYKIGKYAPGTKIPIVAPNTKEQPDYYLLTIWNYLDGILDRERAFREKGGKFLCPIPYPKII